ncbi:MAG: sulfatase-like hydrolase/transferase [Crocinitomix sp.]|nr:sulfatase-like hydrolase/transferase [Crocinitomix sp.]
MIILVHGLESSSYEPIIHPKITIMSFGKLKKQPNILVLMTDQERDYQDFPDSFVENHLGSMKRMRLSGMTFSNNIGNTMPCGPVRGVIFSGQYSHTNRVMNNGDTLYAPHRNFVKTFENAGYEFNYKGKYHLEQSFVPFSTNWVNYFDNDDEALAIKLAQAENEVAADPIGMKGWTSPDFGTANVASTTGPVSKGDIGNLGGGPYSNDRRIVFGASEKGPDDPIARQLFEGANEESVIGFLKRKGKENSDQPWCLVSSILNPHDISLYPYNWQQIPEYSTFDPNDPMFDNFVLPESYYLDNLTNKPAVQLAYVNSFDGGRLPKDQALNYLKFYAYLHKKNEPLINAILDQLDESGLAENTIVIRMADHGEAGCSHFGLRQKTNNFYKECVRLPMVWSNPILWPPVMDIKDAASTDDLVSVVDLLPTLAKVIGVSKAATDAMDLHGNHYSHVLLDDSLPTQKSTLFRFNVFPAGNPYAKNTVPGIANIIAGIKTGKGFPDYPNYKYAVYYAKVDALIDHSTLQFEMYNLDEDKDEINNLAPLNGSPSGEYSDVQIALHQALTVLLHEKNEIEEKSGWPVLMAKD